MLSEPEPARLLDRMEAWTPPDAPSKWIDLERS
jgi:hypothetical protein